MADRSAESDSIHDATGNTPEHGVDTARAPDDSAAGHPAGNRRVSIAARISLAFLSASLFVYIVASAFLATRVASDVYTRVDRQMEQILDMITYSYGGRTIIPLGSDYTSQMLMSLKDRFLLSSESIDTFDFVVLTTYMDDKNHYAVRMDTTFADDDLDAARALRKIHSELYRKMRAGETVPEDDALYDLISENGDLSGQARMVLGNRKYRVKFKGLIDTAANRRHDVFVLYPESVVTRAQFRALWPIILILLIGLALIAGVSLWVGRRIARPIKQLSQAAGEVARGNLDIHIDLKTNDELEDLAESFNAMTTGLLAVQAALVQSEKMATVGQMATSMAHEIRNPLTSISMNVQLLKRRVQDARDIKSVELSLREIDRLQRYIQELLDFARPSEPVMTSVSLKTVVSDIAELHREHFEHGHVMLDVRAPDGLPIIQADEGKLRQLITNLLINARQAIARSGTVTVSVFTGGGAVHIRFTDDGAGIDDTLGDTVFQPFFSTKTTGTGLGLAVVRQIADAHGWRVSYGRRDGHDGTWFDVAIPL